MEPIRTPLTTRIFMGMFPVVEVKPFGGITISIGGKVHITIHIGDLSHSIRPGDKLPLFTEIPNAHTGPTSEQ